jgi:2-succinyl-5-enolpyruvyl-6-hydroxy-3-cyclohexene-1-carboxylate synthase
MAGAIAKYTLLRAFVDELARCGMRAACTSPGSRNAPLLLSLAREPRLACWSHVDERAAGFFALGLAKASGLPVAVAVTSGTAAAELAPAVIEAYEARVPLLVLSADRPAELRQNGAGQAIDQLKLYGNAAKWFFEVEADYEADAGARLRWARTLACRAYWTALEGRPGPVHLNFPLREPLVPDAPLPDDDSGRSAGRPFVSRAPAVADAGAAAAALGEIVWRARRGVLVAGRHERATPLGAAAASFAHAAGWPLLADPLSGARRGQAAIAHYDALLRDGAFAQAFAPDLVLRVGDLPVSKPLRSWLAGLDGVPQVALDPEGAWQDPDAVLSASFALEPAETLDALTRCSQGPAAPAGVVEDDWLESWRSADERAAEAIIGALGDEALSEPRVASELGVLLPEEATLFVASSMPVRDIESFWPVREDPPRVLCNRGANGIDGTVSGAFGALAAGAGPVVLLIGDVALAHDAGGLLAARRLGLPLTIVAIENRGGGIFDFLPVAGSELGRERPPLSEADEDLYTRHIATPTGLSLERLADAYGIGHERVSDVRGFRMALERALASGAAGIIEVGGDRAANVEVHRRAAAAVASAVSPRAAAAEPAA